MRILHICARLDEPANGVVRAVTDMASQAAAMGHDVTILSASHSALSLHAGVSVVLSRPIRLSRGIRYAPTMPRLLRNLLRSHDVLHCHSLWSSHSLFGLRAARLSGTPYVVSPHNDLRPALIASLRPHYRLAWRFSLRQNVSEASCLHATSSIEAAHCALAAPAAAITRVPLSVTVPRLESPIPAPARRLLFIGSFEPVKNIPALLQAWQRCGPLTADWELHCFGPDPLGHRRMYETMANQLGCRRVFFSGPVVGEEKHRLIARSWGLVLPSMTENFGLVVAEALAHGLPVVVTNGTPWAQIAQRGCGWLVTPDVDGIAKGLNAMIRTSPKERAFMGERGRHWMAADFSPDRCGAALLDMYEWARRKCHVQQHEASASLQAAG